MPINDFESTFERIVLTQGAISARKEMEKWLKAKEQGKALDPDRGHSQAEVAENLYQTFIKYHKTIFKYASRYNKRRDTHSNGHGIDRVFQMEQLQDPNAENHAENLIYLANLKQIFEDFVQLNYDENGNRKTDIDPAKATQALYEDLKRANNDGAVHFVPLRYLRFPAGLMIAQIGSGDKWQDINGGQGIDFTRGDKPNGDLDNRFRDAFNATLDKIRNDEFERSRPSHYLHHYESYVTIGGHRFPCLKFPDWEIGLRTHLITDNGYTVNMTNELRDHIAEQLRTGGRADKLMIDLTPQENHDDSSTWHLSDLIETQFTPSHATPKQLQWAQHGIDALQRLKQSLEAIKKEVGKNESGMIDGHQVQPGKATLVSMDIDLLTGLSLVGGADSEVARLGAFITKHTHDIRQTFPADLTVMSDFLALFPEPGQSLDHTDNALQTLRAIAASESNTAILELIDAAAPHIKALAPTIMKATDEAFAGRTPTQGIQPRFFMTIGGVAAGKSNGEKLAREECGDNFVTAELDMVRSKFARQAINLATDNHNFDYKNIEQAGKVTRALVLERGRKHGYNMLLDGSGIPYENRYAPILEAFKDNNYETNIFGFDRTLYVSDQQKREQLSREFPRKAPQDAFLQQGIRIGHFLRAVPVKIIANNYASVPEALLQASQDEHVDRFWLLDTNPRDQGVMKPYILSFTAEVTLEQLEKLDKLQGEELKVAIVELESGNTKIARALHHPDYQPVNTPGKQWNFKVVAKMKETGHYRIEVITDAERYLGTLEKGLFNLDANGPEALFKLTKPMSFDVEGLFQNERHTLNMSPDQNISVDELPEIPCATQYSAAALKRKHDLQNMGTGAGRSMAL